MINQFVIGSIKTFTITVGVTGAAITPVDLGGNYRFVRITCLDASKVQADTALTALVGYTASDTVAALYEQNDPSALWSKGAIPATGTMAFVLTHALGVHRIQLVLSKVTSGGSAVFSIQGFDKGI